MEKKKKKKKLMESFVKRARFSYISAVMIVDGYNLDLYFHFSVKE